MEENQAKIYFQQHNHQGVTQFHLDICQDNPEPALIKLPYALQYQIMPAMTMRDQFSPLHLAAQFSNLDVVQKLVESNLFEINARDYKQRSALHIAAMAGRLEIARYLIAQGADLTLTDQAGFTAFRLDDQSTQHCYFKLSANDLLELYQAFDPNRKDKSGLPAPFITRHVPLHRPETLGDLKQIIEKFNLTGDSQCVQHHLTSAADTTFIPNYGHFIWIGSVLTNPDYLNNILSVKRLFPKLLVVLWVERVDENLLAWCKEHEVAALSVDLLVDNLFSNVDFYLLDIQKGNPGGAVDNLRLECLDRFGGWYFDTDVQCTQEVDPRKYAEYKILLFYYKLDNIAYYNNCILAATANNTYLKMLKRSIAYNYRNRKYDPASPTRSGYEMRSTMTIKTSGPNNLNPLLCLHLTGADPKIGLLDTNYFATTCDRTWVSPNNKFAHFTSGKEQAKLALQHLVNNITHDALLDPSTLYFDLYEPLFKKYEEYHLSSFTLHFLISFLPTSLQGIKRLITNGPLVEQLNFKNQFANEDIIAYYKKELAILSSEYKPPKILPMSNYESVSDTEKNNSFYDTHTWQTIQNHIIRNPNFEFANEMSKLIAENLLMDDRILRIKRAENVLTKVKDSNNVRELKAAIIEVGEIVSNYLGGHR